MYHTQDQHHCLPEINAKDQYGHTQVAIAAINGDLTKLIMLLYPADRSTTKANIHLVDIAGYSPLMWAAHKGRSRTVNLLLAHGANPDTIGQDGNTALSIAVRHRYDSIAYQLAIASLSQYRDERMKDGYYSGSFFGYQKSSKVNAVNAVIQYLQLQLQEGEPITSLPDALIAATHHLANFKCALRQGKLGHLIHSMIHLDQSEKASRHMRSCLA